MDLIKEGTMNERMSDVFRKSSGPMPLEQSALKKQIVGHEVREQLQPGPVGLVNMVRILALTLNETRNLDRALSRENQIMLKRIILAFVGRDQGFGQGMVTRRPVRGDCSQPDKRS